MAKDIAGDKSVKIDKGTWEKMHRVWVEKHHSIKGQIKDLVDNCAEYQQQEVTHATA